MNEKKVSLTIKQDTYQRLSDYSNIYGTSIRHMIHLLIDDSIENDRYREIFSNRNKMSHVGTKAISIQVNVKRDPKNDKDEKPLNDLTIDTSVSEADEIIEALKDEFNNNDTNSTSEQKDPIVESRSNTIEENKPISDTAIDEDDKDLDFKIFLGEK